MNLIKIDEDGNLNIDTDLWLFEAFSNLRTAKYLTEKGNLDGRRVLPSNRTSLIPKHLRVLKYLYLQHHPKVKMEYEFMTDKDRKENNLAECKLELDKKDTIFEAAEKKFIELCSSIELVALDSCRQVVHTVIEANTKVNELLQQFLLSDDDADIDSVLKKSSIVMDNVNKLDKLLSTLNTLKDRYKKQFASEDAIRGEQEEGFGIADI